MKKIELHQMEKIDGGANGRQCFIAGLIAPIAAVATNWAGLVGSLFAANALKCFNDI